MLRERGSAGYLWWKFFVYPFADLIYRTDGHVAQATSENSTRWYIFLKSY